MTKRTRNVLLLLLAVFCLPFLILAVIVAFLVLRPLPPLTPLPNPHAYNDLVKAGGMVSTNTVNFAKLSVYQLRPLVDENAAALSQARDALDSPCRVRVQYSQDGSLNLSLNYNKLRQLAQAFAAEARLAGLDNRPGKSAECDLDLIRLGADAARGGILVDVLIGSSIEFLGVNDLPKWVNQLDAPTCREMAAALERLDAEKPAWSGALKQEDAWLRRTFGAVSVLAEFQFHREMKRGGARAQKNYQAEQLKLRRLELDLASRAYQLDKGHPPAGAAALVPEYLTAVPKNPITGKNLN